MNKKIETNKTKKLVLSKQAIRVLDNGELENAAGGRPNTMPQTYFQSACWEQCC